MCLLCVLKPGAEPNEKHLFTSADNNPDGFGYAFHLGDTIVTGRGMDKKDVIGRFMTLREKHPNTWAMFHARYATHGSINKDNCHPFRVDGSVNTVIGHNGILKLEPQKDDNRSDTRIFADTFLPALGLDVLDDPHLRLELEKWLDNSKVALFSIDPILKYQVYILNENLGHWVDDIWYSNDTYEKLYYYPTRLKSLYSLEDYAVKFNETSCPICENDLTDDELFFEACRHCDTCLACMRLNFECDCYSPSGYSYGRNHGAYQY